MKTRDEVLQVLKEVLPGLRSRYGVRALSLFGSWARGEQTAKSDVDVAVSFVEAPDLWRYFDLRDELSAALGMSVDLVCREGLKPLVLERVVREEVAL